MKPEERQTCRIVIQRIRAESEIRFRVVLYQDSQVCGLSEFAGLRELRQAVQAAFPDVPDAVFLDQPGDHETRIICDMRVDLSEACRTGPGFFYLPVN